MPRGSEYANDLPQSDNAIDAGENKIHGASVRLSIVHGIIWLWLDANSSRETTASSVPDVPLSSPRVLLEQETRT